MYECNYSNINKNCSCFSSKLFLLCAKGGEEGGPNPSVQYAGLLKFIISAVHSKDVVFVSQLPFREILISIRPFKFYIRQKTLIIDSNFEGLVTFICLAQWALLGQSRSVSPQYKNCWCWEDPKQDWKHLKGLQHILTSPTAKILVRKYEYNLNKCGMGLYS